MKEIFANSIINSDCFLERKKISNIWQLLWKSIKSLNKKLSAGWESSYSSAKNSDHWSRHNSILSENHSLESRCDWDFKMLSCNSLENFLCLKQLTIPRALASQIFPHLLEELVVYCINEQRLHQNFAMIKDLPNLWSLEINFEEVLNSVVILA